MHDTTAAERKPLTTLEGRPIFVGDILYGLNGTKFKASTTGHRDYPMAMIDLATVRDNTWSQWLTGTHWQGQQVLFWSPDDIPPPAERTLGTRLRDQLNQRKERRERTKDKGVKRRRGV